MPKCTIRNHTAVDGREWGVIVEARETRAPEFSIPDGQRTEVHQCSDSINAATSLPLHQDVSGSPLRVTLTVEVSKSTTDLCIPEA